MAEAKAGEPAVLNTPPEGGRYMTIGEALAAVMGEVQSISKESRNTQQNYNFRGIDAVVNAVGPAFRKYQVLCIPIKTLYQAEYYETSKGTNMRDVTVTVTFRFYGPAGDWIEAEVCGEAADAGDKATPKAHSVAYRTLLLQALCIPTDERDPDADAHERGSQPVRRQEGPLPIPVPHTWTELEHLVRGCDNADEAWGLFEAYIRAASYHLFGETDSAALDQGQKDTIWQKAAGAAVWLAENAPNDGAFTYYDESIQRQAWASVLDGHLLPIPDYEPPLDPRAQEEMDAAEAEARMAEADADTGYS